MTDQSYGSGKFPGPQPAGPPPAVDGPAVRQAPEPPHVPAAPPAAPAPAGVPAPPTGPTGSAVGSGTVAGHRGLTAAQRARAEGLSPIIEPGPVPAALTAVLALLLAGAAAVGRYPLLVPVLVLQAVTAAGWFRLNGMWPARQGIALAFLGAVAADTALLLGGDDAPAALLAALGAWLLLCLALQLRSRAPADERISGLMATVVSTALAVTAAGHLAADRDAVTVCGLVVAAAIPVRAVPAPTVLSVPLALAAAAAAGYGAAGVVDCGASDAALLGFGAGVCALLGHRVASYDYPSRFVHMTAGVALPLAAAAPVVHLLGRALV